jgi:hypothetical protein
MSPRSVKRGGSPRAEAACRRLRDGKRLRWRACSGGDAVAILGSIVAQGDDLSVGTP